MAYTPGPWKVANDRNGWPHQIYAEDGTPITSMRSIRQPTMPEGVANAALIAAAPDLVEALTELTNAADDVGVSHFDTDTMDPDVQALQMATQEARAALAKAAEKD